MKILLVGEYSRLHWTLYEALVRVGHDVVVASDGDGFKGYPRNIDLTRKSSGVIDTFSNLASVFKHFSRFKGFDVVQLINPCFTDQNMRVNELLFHLLKKNNRKVFLGAFGDDSYWVKACLSNKVFKYSEFFVDDKSTNLKYNRLLIEKWIGSSHERINVSMAHAVDGIVACLYEYYMAYSSAYPHKLAYIPLPVNLDVIPFAPIRTVPQKIKFFIGVNKERSEYKGTDIMERALNRLVAKYPEQVIATRAESVAYDTYWRLMSESDVVLDQLYSHSPAMNALLAMAQGKIVVGGGEPEMYDLMSEFENRPIINVHPTEEDVFDKLENLVLNKSIIPELSFAGRSFVEKHHDYMRVANQYLDFWKKR